MSTQIISIAVSVICVIAAVMVAYKHGFKNGERRGRDDQWIDDYFLHQKRLKEARDKSGKFVSKKENK